MEKWLSPQLSVVLLLTLSLQLPARGSYLLVTEFHTYTNSLHSFINTSASPFTTHCCDGRESPDCTDPCNTVLNYCFKDIGTVNSFVEDSTVLYDCKNGRRSLTELVERTDSIDFSDPPLSISGSRTWTSISNRGDIWPGGIQFFVRSVSDGQIVDYLSINIDLKPGENVTNEILTGHHFGESITFTVSFFLTCTFNYYGENCSLYCEPGGSRDHGYYSCSTQGAKICDEYFGGSDCNECDNGFEYPHCWPDVCSLLHPCMEGNCTSASAESYTCDCNDGFYGVNCSNPVPDMCSLLNPCHGGNCSNTAQSEPGYRCTCSEGFHGVNCTDEEEPTPEVDKRMIYLWLIGAGVVGLLAPVVILSPLLLILCFTALGSWRNKNKEYVNNPLYGEASAPASATGTFRSETGTDHSLSTVEVLNIHSDCSTDTLTPPPRMEEPNYDIIPGESRQPIARGRVSLEVTPSLADTFKADDISSYYTLSVSTNESICPYNLSDYDVPPPPLPARGFPPGSFSNSFKSESGHSFLEMTTIADNESQTYYRHPIPHDPVTHSDLAKTPPQSNGALWVNSHLPQHHQNLGLQRSKTIGGHLRIRHTNSFKARSRHHHQYHHHHHHHHHRRLSKSGSAGGYVSPRQYGYSLDQPKMTPYGQRRGLPPVPPHGIPTSHNHLNSSFDDRKAFTLGAETSPNYLQFMSDHSQVYGSDSTVVASEMDHSGWGMNIKEITAPLGPPKIIIGDSDSYYDKVQDDVYDELVPNQNPTGHEHYDVPRKNSSAA